ncbi:MAG: hypothetical protein ACP5IE_02095 [Infirmifilum sp.]
MFKHSLMSAFTSRPPVLHMPRYADVLPDYMVAFDGIDAMLRELKELQAGSKDSSRNRKRRRHTRISLQYYRDGLVWGSGLDPGTTTALEDPANHDWTMNRKERMNTEEYKA